MTAPLVPADVDLRGMPWMPLDTVRLIDSDLFALSTGDEFKAAVALWCKSWTQVPAASLPDDDRILAHLSGTASRWKRVKAMAMRGWVRCDDGRFYHPVIAEKALEAWEERLEFRDKQDNENTRVQNYRMEHKALRVALREHGVVMPFDSKIGDLRARLEALQRSKPETQPETQPETKTFQDGNACNAPVMAKTGTGTGIYQEQEQKHARIDSPETPATPARSTDAARACLLLRQAGCARVNPGHPDLLAALAEGVAPETIRDTYAEKPDAANPFAWAIATARGRHAEGPKQISTGPPTARASSDSKTLTALKKLQGLKTDETLPTRVAAERDSGRLIEARDAES